MRDLPAPEPFDEHDCLIYQAKALQRWSYCAGPANSACKYRSWATGRPCISRPNRSLGIAIRLPGAQHLRQRITTERIAAQRKAPCTARNGSITMAPASRCPNHGVQHLNCGQHPGFVLIGPPFALQSSRGSGSDRSINSQSVADPVFRAFPPRLSPWNAIKYGMFHRSHFPVFALVAGIGLSVCSLALRAQNDNYHGRKYKAPPPSAHIEVTVLKDFNGKPITNAHVIFHPTEGDRDKGSLEVKTNEDGKAIIDVIPYRRHGDAAGDRRRLPDLRPELQDRQA
jgi:hypothetical protein